MTQQPLKQQQRAQSILKSIEADMDVYDRAGNKFGEVADMFFGAAGDESLEGVEPASISDAVTNDGNEMNELIEDFARVLGGEDRIPEELRRRLLHDGFIRVDADGLFAADRYVTPDQIASVDEKGVHLKVTRDELIRR